MGLTHVPAVVSGGPQSNEKKKGVEQGTQVQVSEPNVPVQLGTVTLPLKLAVVSAKSTHKLSWPSVVLTWQVFAVVKLTSPLPEMAA